MWNLEGSVKYLYLTKIPDNKVNFNGRHPSELGNEIYSILFVKMLKNWFMKTAV